MGEGTESFNLSEWMDEALGGSGELNEEDDATAVFEPDAKLPRPPSTAMRGREEVLQQLQIAAANNNHQEVVRLAQALLPLTTGRRKSQVLDFLQNSARTLVDLYVPASLDIALRWAAIWCNAGRTEENRQVQRELEARIRIVRGREQKLAAAIDAYPLAGLVQALHEVAVVPDQLSTTDTLVRRGSDALTRREQSLLAHKQEVEACLPERLDRAAALMTEIFNEEPDRANQERLANINARFEKVRQLMSIGEAALAGRRPADLEHASQLLRASADKIAGFDDLLQRLDALSAGAEEAIATYRDDAQRFLQSAQLHKAIKALTALAELAPEAPEIAQLPILQRTRDELLALQQQLAAATDARQVERLRELARRIRNIRHHLPQTAGLLDDAKVIIEEVDAARRRSTRRTITALVIVGILLAIPITIYLRDSDAFRSAQGLTETEARRQALRAYLDEPSHLFFKRDAEALLTTDRYDEYQKNLNAARAEVDPEARRLALQAFIETYADQPAAARMVEEAQARLQTDADLAARNTYLAVSSIPDLRQRQQALQTYVTEPHPQNLREAAEKALIQIRQQLDQEAWDAAKAEGPERLQRLQAYLAGDTERRYRAEAEAAIARLQDQRATSQAEAAEAALWQQVEDAADDASRRQALQNYLQKTELGRHRAKAGAQTEALRGSLENSAFAAARDTVEPQARIDALRQFLTQHPEGVRAADAQREIARAEREFDAGRWRAATLPAKDPERLAQVDAYLASPGPHFFITEAEQQRRILLDKIDFAAFDRARGLPTAGQRVLALDHYLNGETTLSNADAARRSRDAALQEIATYPARDLLPLPFEILSRLPGSSLRGLPDTVLLQLPADALLRIPSERFNQMRIDAFAGLPLPIQLRVRRYPSWATSTGVDAAGPWATIELHQDFPLTFRYIPGLPASLSAAGGLGEQAGSPCWLASEEISQRLWEWLLGRRANPSISKGDQLPVHGANHQQIQDFFERLRHRGRRQQGFEAVNLPQIGQLFAAAMLQVDAAGLVVKQRGDGTWQALPASAERLEAVSLASASNFGCKQLYGNVAEAAYAGGVEARHLVAAIGPFVDPTIQEFSLPYGGTQQNRTGIRPALPSLPDEIRPPAQ